MSAWVHDVEHIRALVQFGLDHGRRYTLRWGTRPLTKDEYELAYATGLPWGPEARTIAMQTQRELTPETAGLVGAMLLHENQRSVNFRYNEDDLEPVYEHRAPRYLDGGIREFSPIQILHAISSYEYQSCEHPEWSQSESQMFCHALRKLAINALPGYGDAGTWSINPTTKAEWAASLKGARA